MVRQLIYTDDDFTKFKCKVKVGNKWVDYSGSLFSDAVDGKYPTVRPVAGETLFLYYEMPLPIRTTNFTLWFGTESSKIRYGLYDVNSFEAFVEYDKGCVEVNGVPSFFPNDIKKGSHWFNLHFNDSADEIIFQTSKVDGIENPETVPISESEINTNNLCYIGVMYTVSNNDNWDDLAIWIERLRVYYTKIVTSAEISFDSDGFVHPTPVTGIASIITEFGTILNNNDVTLIYTQDNETRTIPLTNVGNNIFTFTDTPQYNTKQHNYTLQFKEETIFEPSHTSSKTYYKAYAKIVVDEEKYFIPPNDSLNIQCKLLFADEHGEYTLLNPLQKKYPQITRPPVLIEIFDKTGKRIVNGIALADGNSDYLTYDSPPISKRGTYTVKISFLGELLEKTYTELINYKHYDRDGQHIGLQQPAIASMATYNQVYTNNISKTVTLVVGGDDEAVVTLDIGNETQYYPNPVSLTSKVYDLDDKPIPDKSLNIIVDGIIIDTVLTDENGTVEYTFTPTPLNGDYHQIYVELDDEDDEYYGESLNYKLYYINKSKIVIDSSSLNQKKNVFETAKIKFKVYDSANNLINDGGVNVLVHYKNDDIIFQEDGVLFNGLFEETFVNDKIGDIDSTVLISFAGNENVAGTTAEFKIHWNRLKSIISMASGEYTLEALETNTCVFKVTSELNAIITQEQISIITEFLSYDGDFITDMDDAPSFPILDDNGTATVSYSATRGDVVQRIGVTYDGNDLYKPQQHTFYIRWKKIATSITASDVTHYSGRYTLIDEGADQSPSPGTNPNYNNFRSKVTVVSHSKIKVVDDGFVSWREFANMANELLTTDVDSKGNANGRYTRTVNAEKTTTIKAEYYGTDVFAPCSINITLKTLPRINPNLVLNFVHLHDAPFRYNIPFVIEATLKEGTTPLKYSLGCYVDDALYDTKTTNNEGKASFKQYTPTIVGKLKVESRFNEDDLIDKYNPTISSETLTIDKDYTFLTLKTGTNTYTSCGDALINLTLTDSIKRGISDALILLKYDDGSYINSPTWQNIENLENPTTNSSGKASVNIEAYSGIRLVQGIFEETWCYYSTQGICEVIYEISRTYTANINKEGIAEIPVDCYLDATKGLPNGLYDVILEYIPPETENGKCPLYGSSMSKEAMRKKRSRNLRCLTEYLITEAHIPIFLTTELTNIKNKPQTGIKELSKVNNGNSSEPLHITDENGQIVRGACTGIIGNNLHFYFYVDQSRKNIGASLMVDVTVTKMTPILEVTHEITGYSGVKMDLTARLYNTFKKYDKYGQEVHINEDGDLLYYNPISDKYYNIKNEGEENEEKIPITKEEYTNANPITTIEPLPNRTVTWYGIDGKTELVSAITDENGIATAQYARISIGTVNITARTEEENDYYGRTETIKINTLDREQPYFAEIDFDEKDSNGNYTKSTIYDHPTKLYTWLYIDINGVKTPFANQTVEFRQSGEILGTATTNNQGYAEITKTIKNTVKYAYQAYFASKDKYKSATMVYRIHVEKQTPLLTLQASKTTANLRDEITLTANLTEDTIANKKVMSNRGITFLDNDKGISYNTTDADGIATIKYKLEHAGKRTIKARYATENDAFNPVETTITINVNKMNTYFEGVDGNTIDLAGLTSTETKVTLKNAKGEKLISQNVTITYNDKTWSAKTDGQGELLLQSSAFEKDVTKTAHFVYNGNDNYNGCTYDLTFKWGDYENSDNCKDLNTFEALRVKWYASNDNKTGIPGTSGNCWLSYGGVKRYYCLRKVCGDLKKEGEYDTETGQVAAPTGIVLRNKNLVTTSKCTIKFYFQMKYDGVSNNIAPRLYGGHIGLMKKTATHAENAPIRFEFYRNNSYFISNGDPNAKKTKLAYAIEPNKEYCVELKINGLKITMTWYNEKGVQITSPITETAQGVSSLAGLYLYAFVFTNGTKFVLHGLDLTED